MNTYNLVCLAIVYHEQSRIADAEAALTKIERTLGEAGAIQYVEIYAQWNDIPTALSWLDTAYRVHDTGLVSLNRDVLLDPVRTQARFQEIERKLNFPN